MQNKQMALKGISVLVTRPQHQAQNLCDLIQKQGGTVLLLPTLEIVPLSINPNVLPKYIDKAIFISANAVNYGLQHLPETKQLVAIGKKTAQILQQQTQRTILTAPEPYNSEALLKHTELQDLSGQQIVIFRGQGGRDLLAETLGQRGANVCYLDVYQRQKPIIDTTWLESEQIDIVIVTSGDSLQNLFSMLKEQQWLKIKPIVTMSQRVTDLAHQYTQALIYTASVASDEGLLAALLKWKQQFRD